MTPVLLLAAVCIAVAHSTTSMKNDLRRAMTKLPGPAYRGQGTLLSMNAALNKHLQARQGLKTAACEKYTVEQLQQLMRKLAPRADEHLISIYEVTNDNRRERPYAKESLQHLANFAQVSTEWHKVLRDGHCHQAVLAFVHHLSSPTQASLAAEPDFTLPLLPISGIHSPPAAGAAQDAQEIYKEYAASVSCTVCHSGSPPAQSDKDAPEWPPVVAPVIPYQFNAQSSAWTEQQNMTLYGSWHYDFLNNRMAQYYALGGFNMTQVWLANPPPAGEGDAEQVYGPGAKRGAFYVFTKPAPSAPLMCSTLSYPGFSIPHPDVFSSKMIGSENVNFAGRKQIDGGKGKVWADHYTYNFNMSAGNPCNAMFEVYMDIHDGIPVMDYGPNGCDATHHNKAMTKWWDLERVQPDLRYFTDHNYTACESLSSVEELEIHLLQQAAPYLQTTGTDAKTLRSAIQAGTSTVARYTLGMPSTSTFHVPIHTAFSV